MPQSTQTYWMLERQLKVGQGTAELLTYFSGSFYFFLHLVNWAAGWLVVPHSVTHPDHNNSIRVCLLYANPICIHHVLDPPKSWNLFANSTYTNRLMGAGAGAAGAAGAPGEAHYGDNTRIRFKLQHSYMYIIIIRGWNFNSICTPPAWVIIGARLLLRSATWHTSHTASHVTVRWMWWWLVVLSPISAWYRLMGILPK